MIKIRRSGQPMCLTKPANQFVENDYKRAEVKSSLLDMQHGKCCYCERKIIDLSSREKGVEHYIPKSAFKDGNGNIQWHLANEWNNLLYACIACNGTKWNKSPTDEATGTTLIINPSLDDPDPEDHIDFYVDGFLILFCEKNGSHLGRSTIEKLGFRERHDLLRSFRKIKVEIDLHFMELLDASISGDLTTVASKTLELERNTSAHHSFAAFRRRYIGKIVQEFNANRQRYMDKNGQPLGGIEVHIHKGYDVEP